MSGNGYRVLQDCRARGGHLRAKGFSQIAEVTLADVAAVTGVELVGPPDRRDPAGPVPPHPWAGTGHVQKLDEWMKALGLASDA